MEEIKSALRKTSKYSAIVERKPDVPYQPVYKQADTEGDGSAFRLSQKTIDMLDRRSGKPSELDKPTNFRLKGTLIKRAQ